MLRLAAGDYALTLAPERGGALLGFDWRGEPLMRPLCGPAVLDAASRPLAPFFLTLGDEPPADRRKTWLGTNPLHGLDWLTEWSIATATRNSATLLQSLPDSPAGPARAASQAFALDESGLTISATLVNLSDHAVPAPLGARARFPMGARAVAPCSRPLELRGSGQGLTVVLEPSDNLAITGLTAPDHAIRCCTRPATLAPGGVASASLKLRATARR